MVMMTTRKMVTSDVRLRHATAIIMLGVIGAEFQKEIDPINSKSKSKWLTISLCSEKRFKEHVLLKLKLIY
jgi:hypothetical protein